MELHFVTCEITIGCTSSILGIAQRPPGPVYLNICHHLNT